MDSVTCKLLNCSHEKINEYEFFNLLDKISKNPVDGYKHVYCYSSENQTIYIKMNIFESSDVWLGFVQDYTRQISEFQSEKNSIDYNSITRLPSYSSFTHKVKELLPSIKNCCLATMHINGIDKLSSFLTVENTNSCITSVAEVLKSFESEKIILGTKSNYEMPIFTRKHVRLWLLTTTGKQLILLIMQLYFIMNHMLHQHLKWLQSLSNTLSLMTTTSHLAMQKL